MTERASRRGGGLRRRLLVAGGTLVLLLLAAEAAVRLLVDVPFLGTSLELFVENRFGPSRGNAANVEAVAFGVPARTDAQGFRVPTRDFEQEPGRALLIVGDSVAFGPGVQEPETLAGLLRADLPGWTVLNAAVIGHDVHDYLNVVRTVLAERDDVARVLLVYCLNDLTRVSASEIDQALAEDGPRKDLGDSWLQRLRDVRLFAAVNAFLRERSKLYLFTRNALTDPPLLYFRADLEAYTAGEEAVFRGLRPLAEIAELLRVRGIPLTVVISPHAVQVREARDDWRLPQRLVSDFLAREGIESVDALPALEAVGPAAFLRFDPMHLSAAGHRALEAIVLPRLED